MYLANNLRVTLILATSFGGAFLVIIPFTLVFEIPQVIRGATMKETIVPWQMYLGGAGWVALSIAGLIVQCIFKQKEQDEDENTKETFDAYASFD